uniref:Uncharacterized protein n=1 Tax=Arundo donax TaxID=35708 RepID=A0A0A9EXZ6_ARUDO
MEVPTMITLLKLVPLWYQLGRWIHIARTVYFNHLVNCMLVFATGCLPFECASHLTLLTNLLPSKNSLEYIGPSFCLAVSICTFVMVRITIGWFGLWI